MRLTDMQDAFGHEIHDYHTRKTGFEIVERDDGYFDVSTGPAAYFLEYNSWSESERKAMKHAQGHILDIGCGAGRHAIYLQSKGFTVTGIDTSPLAVHVCKARGLQDVRVMPITKISRKLGRFDTILMMGNNFALMGNPRRMTWLLKRFHAATSASARIIAQTRDPYQTDVPEHLAYHAQNRKNGKMSGEARIRIRYKQYTTPWIDFLMVSADELKKLLEKTRWKLRDIITESYGMYVAVLEKR